MSGAQSFRFQMGDDRVYQIRGIKLLEACSRGKSQLDMDRWCTLELFWSREEMLVLVLTYESETTNPEEKEERHVHVEKIKHWSDLARFLDSYDFMQHVRLDYYCGGHCSLMSGVGQREARLTYYFRQFAMEFLGECILKKADWYVHQRIDMW